MKHFFGKSQLYDFTAEGKTVKIAFPAYAAITVKSGTIFAGLVKKEENECLYVKPALLENKLLKIPFSAIKNINFFSSIQFQKPLQEKIPANMTYSDAQPAFEMISDLSMPGCQIRVKMISGDTLYGSVLLFNEKILVLDDPVIGIITANTEMISSIMEYINAPNCGFVITPNNWEVSTRVPTLYVSNISNERHIWVETLNYNGVTKSYQYESLDDFFEEWNGEDLSSVPDLSDRLLGNSVLGDKIEGKLFEDIMLYLYKLKGMR